MSYPTDDLQQMFAAAQTEVSREPITQQWIDLAHDLHGFVGVHMGGSYLVLGDKANDIDLFMTEQTWRSLIEPYLVKTDMYKHITVNDYGAKLYADDGGYALEGVYNIGAVQVILVKPQYVPAYIKCAQIMLDAPNTFQEKADRIALHRILRYLCTIGELQNAEIQPKE